MDEGDEFVELKDIISSETMARGGGGLQREGVGCILFACKTQNNTTNNNNSDQLNPLASRDWARPGEARREFCAGCFAPQNHYYQTQKSEGARARDFHLHGTHETKAATRTSPMIMIAHEPARASAKKGLDLD